MRILITGSKGQLGKELQRSLGQKNQNLLLAVDIDRLDITDASAVEEAVFAFKPDVIINCAAYTDVDGCEDNEEMAATINASGAGNLAAAASEAGAEVIQISTDYVFDGTTHTPYTEKDIPNPKSIYGKTKLAGEYAVMENNTRSYIIRTAWLYGDGNNFVRTMLNLARDRRDIKVVDDQRGTPTSTAQLARAVEAVMHSGKYGIYHATCEGSCTWYEFACEIFKTTGLAVNLTPCTSAEFTGKAPRPAYSVLKNTNLRDNTGLVLSHWKDALHEYLKGETI